MVISWSLPFWVKRMRLHLHGESQIKDITHLKKIQKQQKFFNRYVKHCQNILNSVSRLIVAVIIYRMATYLMRKYFTYELDLQLENKLQSSDLTGSVVVSSGPNLVLASYITTVSEIYKSNLSQLICGQKRVTSNYNHKKND